VRPKTEGKWSMAKLELIHIKNEMLGANALANLIGVFFLNQILLGAEGPLPREIWQNPIATWIDRIFIPFAFGFVAITTLVYEGPIRAYLNNLYKQVKSSPDLTLKARRRVLNEPFFAIALDSSMWLLATLIYPTLHWAFESGGQMVERTILLNLSTALVTVTCAFFFLEHVSQKRLAPLFFPEGGLSKVPRTIRIRIRTRLLALLFACNVIPLTSLMLIVHRMSSNSPGDSEMSSAVFTIAVVFIAIGSFLTMLVSRNLSRPFNEILSTLSKVRNGIFDSKVRVTSNDEIGYTGDVVNEMSVGLRERDMIRDMFGRYVAREVRDEILSGRIPLDGEKKDVTVLFCDLRDFTPLAEAYNPKFLVKVMNRYFEEMTEAVQVHGGLVLQFLGDEIYAVFGAPISVPDHPSRALRAALDMNRRLDVLNRSRADGENWPGLKHGIGIHTGEVLAANIGSPDRLSYLLVGGTVNLASRLQSLTKELDTRVIVSLATRSRLKQDEINTVAFSELPPQKLKGIQGPVQLFAVAG